MTAYQATARIFLTAFKTLPRRAQNAVLFTLVRTPKVREDIIDLAIAEKRSAEKARPFRKLLARAKASSHRQ